MDDVESGWIYYKNNVSGETQWDMPEVLDTFGECANLEVLNLCRNVMKGLCNSICRMSKLRRLIVQKNRMHSLPDAIGDLKNLEHINVSDNEMKMFPPSVIECSALSEIFCQGNQLIRLPDLIGTTLPRLEKLVTRKSLLNQYFYPRYKLGLTITRNCHNLTRIFTFTPGIN